MPRKMPRVSTNTEVRLTAITSSHSSSFMRMKRLSWVMPALLTRMSTWPSVFSAVSASCATAGAVAQIARQHEDARAEL